MNRRSFITNALATGAAVSFSPLAVQAAVDKKNMEVVIHSRSLETNFFLKGHIQPLSIMQISDTHISCDSAADVQYEPFSKRMNNAYRQVKHYKTGLYTTPLILFDELLKIAVARKVDLIALTGDIINYPSQTAVDVILEKLKAVNIPYFYTAGNHDWHYEGSEGSDEYKRAYWIENRLKPLYQNTNPFYTARVENGINIVSIDNSTYQINAEQLLFFKNQLALKIPTLLFVHIPLYIEHVTHMSCGHPDWGSNTDSGFKTERRAQWPEAGNSVSTVKFLAEVKNSKNLMGVFAGHWHGDHAFKHGNVNQFVTLPGLNGQYRMIKIQG